MMLRALILGGVFMLVAGCDKTQPSKPVTINNQTCPVTGNSVNDHDTYVHDGKEYKLCSGECKEACSQNPDKYLPK